MLEPVGAAKFGTGLAQRALLQSDSRGVTQSRRNATMPRKREAIIHREPAPDPDTARQLLEAAWPHCGVIQDIIDRLNEAGSNTELRLLTNRLQRLAIRATPLSENREPPLTRP